MEGLAGLGENVLRTTVESPHCATLSRKRCLLPLPLSCSASLLKHRRLIWKDVIGRHIAEKEPKPQSIFNLQQIEKFLQKGQLYP